MSGSGERVVRARLVEVALGFLAVLHGDPADLERFVAQLEPRERTAREGTGPCAWGDDRETLLDSLRRASDRSSTDLVIVPEVSTSEIASREGGASPMRDRILALMAEARIDPERGWDMSLAEFASAVEAARETRAAVADTAPAPATVAPFILHVEWTVVRQNGLGPYGHIETPPSDQIGTTADAVAKALHAQLHDALVDGKIVSVLR